MIFDSNRPKAEDRIHLPGLSISSVLVLARPTSDLPRPGTDKLGPERGIIILIKYRYYVYPMIDRARRPLTGILHKMGKLITYHLDLLQWQEIVITWSIIIDSCYIGQGNLLLGLY